MIGPIMLSGFIVFYVFNPFCSDLLRDWWLVVPAKTTNRCLVYVSTYKPQTGAPKHV